MRKKMLWGLIMISNLFTSSIIAQVGIGTTNPSVTSLLQLDSNTQTFVPPRMTDAQMHNIANPVYGSMIFNTNKDAMYLYTTSGWQALVYGNSPSITLRKQSGLLPINFTNAHNRLPIPLNTTNVSYISGDAYQVLSNGKIKVLSDGVYLLSSSLAITNSPVGYSKYAIGVIINNSTVNFMNRGFMNQPESDWWGTNGTYVLDLNANDEVEFFYDLRSYVAPETILPSETNLTISSLNIGLTKLQ